MATSPKEPVSPSPSQFAIFLQALLFAAVMASVGSLRAESEPTVTFAASIQPLGAILDELVRGRATVARLIPAGSSPHLFEPRPSDIAAAAKAACFFFVDERLDPWAAQMPLEKKVGVFALLPASSRLSFPDEHSLAEKHGAGDHHDHDHDHAGEDPHFWTDPKTVKLILPALAEALAKSDPDGAPIYRTNAARFASELDALDTELAAKLAPVKDRPVMLFHPAFLYMLKRYGIPYLGSIEPAPGREPTPRSLGNIIARLKSNGVRAIFSEPQLARRPAEVIAESAKLKVGELDPNGGVAGRNTYAELMRFNANALAEGLK